MSGNLEELKYKHMYVSRLQLSLWFIESKTLLYSTFMNFKLSSIQAISIGNRVKAKLQTFLIVQLQLWLYFIAFKAVHSVPSSSSHKPETRNL